jgi:hypothetical protein
MHPSKKQFISHGNIPYTQKLFLEIGYDVDVAIYTLKEYDYEYEGKTYPSIKRLYLEMEDIPEYNFANTYFYSWNHWQRISNNKEIKKFVDEWRNELELKLRSQSIRTILDMTSDERGFQAAKYVAEKGWEKGQVGRPKKDTSEQDAKQEKRLHNEFAQDVARLKERKA